MATTKFKTYLCGSERNGIRQRRAMLWPSGEVNSKVLTSYIGSVRIYSSLETISFPGTCTLLLATIPRMAQHSA